MSKPAVSDATEPMQLANATVAERLKSNIRKDNGAAIYVGLKKSGCSGYKYDMRVLSEADLAAHPGEFVWSLMGVVIAIDPESLPHLQGTELDYVEGMLGQSQLIFRNPHAHTPCGCGESIALKPTQDQDSGEERHHG